MQTKGIKIYKLYLEHFDTGVDAPTFQISLRVLGEN